MAEITFGQAIEKIKNSLDIVDVISKYVVLKKSGHNYMGLCPFHNEKTPSFVVTPSKQIFKCFGCGEGGDVLSFLMKINNQDFYEVVREQAENLNIELPKSYNKTSGETQKKEKEVLLAAVRSAMEFYHRNLLNNDKALEYLAKRGVGELAISKFFLGLAPNAMFDLKDYLRSEEGGGFTNDQMLKAGLLYEKQGDYIDRFKNRIIIPIFDVNSNPIAFGARAIMDGQNPKYLNSPDSVIYNKSNIMFGLNSAKDAIKEEDAVIIMEGYFDVISAQVNGVKNTVASCGTALTPQQVKLLSRYTPSRRIYLAFDTDSAGVRATTSGADVIKSIFENLGDIKQYDSSYGSLSNSVCEIRVISFVGGKDPDEFIREFGAEEYKKHIKNAPLFLDFRLEQIIKGYNDKLSSQEKSTIINQIVEILEEIQSPVILADYIRNVSYKINIDENVLKKQLNFLKKNKISPNVTNYEVVNSIEKNKKNSFEERFLRMENNIIKLALSADSTEKRVYLKQSLEGYKSENDKNSAVISYIDKIITKVNNVDEVAKKIFAEFCTDEVIQKHVTDQIYSSKEFEDLNYDDYIQAVKETFERLNNLKEINSRNKLRQKYKSSSATEEEKINISKEIYKQFGLNRRKI